MRREKRVGSPPGWVGAGREDGAGEVAGRAEGGARGGGLSLQPPGPHLPRQVPGSARRLGRDARGEH